MILLFLSTEDINMDDRNNELQELCRREGILAPTEQQENEQEKEDLKDIEESYNVRKFYDLYKEHNWSEDSEAMDMNDEKLKVFGTNNCNEILVPIKTKYLYIFLCTT